MARFSAIAFLISLCTVLTRPLSAGAANEGLQDFVRIYSTYGEALARNYGRAYAVTPHLAYPFGQDNMGAFPAFYIGAGAGAIFANTQAIKNQSDPEVTSEAIPDVLPAPGITLNMGMAINRKWDIRLSVMPPAKISLPSSASSNNVSGSFTVGNAKAKLSYHVVEGGFLLPGLSVSPYLSWAKGNINLSSDSLNVVNRNFAASTGETGSVTNYDYLATTKASWDYYGAGGEVRAWYDLMVFFPYIGYGLGIQTGKFSTEVELDGTITATVPSLGSETESIVAGISENAKPEVFLQRVFFGFEFKIFLLRIGAEVHVALESSLIGASMGAALQF